MKNSKTTLSAALRLPGPSRGFGGSELGLAFLVIAVVAMMIVPLPTMLLDILLATNLAMAVVILVVVLYVPDVLAIATFPTVLLLTTLFRLALNVSSTRLILIQANAGEVIRAFGFFVVRGNYVVGAIVFLILTLIQFLVIAKGSERVAEVGARFTLDAMPGKQMAIDAEQRAGSIDGAEARRRRRALSRESQFFGSMDGAMKFVKGDVIASLIITVINILGGLAIGVGQRGMPAVDALKKYGLLTIGDGLVSQLPALILSMAAGVLVTRTASEEPDTPLGEELSRQLFGIPKALQVGSGFLLLLAVVPGLPGVPFSILAVALFLIARARTKKIAKARQLAASEPTTQAPGSPINGQIRFIPRVVPWGVDVSEDLASLLDDTQARPGLRTLTAEIRETLFAQLGTPVPAPRLRINTALPPRHVTMAIQEVPTKVLMLPADLTDAIAPAALRDEIFAVLRHRAGDFLGIHEVQRLVDELAEFAPAVVATIVGPGKHVSITLLADILRRLVEEGVGVRDLRTIVESLATVAITDKDPLNLTEWVRSNLRRVISYRLTQGASHLNVHLLDPALEDLVQRSIVRAANAQFLNLKPDESREIIRAVRTAIAMSTAKHGDNGGRPSVLLTQVPIRRFVRRLLESELPDLVVTSYAELVPEITLNTIGKATLNGAAA